MTRITFVYSFLVNLDKINVNLGGRGTILCKHREIIMLWKCIENTFTIKMQWKWFYNEMYWKFHNKNAFEIILQ